jgi:hypothetical protein
MRLASVGKTADKTGSRNPQRWTTNFYLVAKGTLLSATLRSTALCFCNLLMSRPDTDTAQDVQTAFAYAYQKIVITV